MGLPPAAVTTGDDGADEAGEDDVDDASVVTDENDGEGGPNALSSEGLFSDAVVSDDQMVDRTAEATATGCRAGGGSRAPAKGDGVPARSPGLMPKPSPRPRLSGRPVLAAVCATPWE